jgi:guanylate kinase
MKHYCDRFFESQFPQQNMSVSMTTRLPMAMEVYYIHGLPYYWHWF